MAYNQHGDYWIDYISRWFDMISRCDDTLESDHEPTQTPDERFFGLNGLEDEILYLYRVLGPCENIENEIVCKDQDSPRKVAQHIASGSRNGSRFISTTADLKVAAYWAFYEMETLKRKPRQYPLRIVVILVKQLIGTETEKNLINLCNKDVREHFIKGATHRSWAISSKEVLFQYRIPKYLPIYLQTQHFTPQIYALRVPFPIPIGTHTEHMPFHHNSQTIRFTAQFYAQTVLFPVLIGTKRRQMALLVNLQTGLFIAKFYEQSVPKLIGQMQIGQMHFHVNPLTGLFTAQFYSQTVPFTVLIDTHTGQMHFHDCQQFLTIYDFINVSKPPQPPPKKPKKKKKKTG